MPAAIAVWTRTSDIEHVYIVGSYFHYSVPGESSELSYAIRLMLGMICTEPPMGKPTHGHTLLGPSMAVQEEINLVFAIEHLGCYAPVV